MDGSNRKEQKMEDNEREGGMYLRAGRAIERRGSAKGACINEHLWSVINQKAGTVRYGFALKNCISP